MMNTVSFLLPTVRFGARISLNNDHPHIAQRYQAQINPLQDLFTPLQGPNGEEIKVWINPKSNASCYANIREVEADTRSTGLSLHQRLENLDKPISDKQIRGFVKQVLATTQRFANMLAVRPDTPQAECDQLVTAIQKGLQPGVKLRDLSWNSLRDDNIKHAHGLEWTDPQTQKRCYVVFKHSRYHDVIMPPQFDENTRPFILGMFDPKLPESDRCQIEGTLYETDHGPWIQSLQFDSNASGDGLLITDRKQREAFYPLIDALDKKSRPFFTRRRGR